MSLPRDDMREPSRSQTSTPNAQKSPLDPNAGDVPVPAGSGNATPEPHDVPSIRHDLNSAHIKKDDISRTSSPGMGTGNNAKDDGPPNWQNQDEILNAASKGHAVDNKTSHADLNQLKKDQHPHSHDGTQSGPTGLLSGQRNMESEGTSEHDRLQERLKDGKPSRDGEGSAGLPFDSGK